jgi:hypothetical protein
MLDYYRFKTVSDLFIQGKTEEARLELAELQRRYVALCDENLTFKMQVQEYEDVLYLARNLILEGQFYWLVTGNVKQGPFCPHCYNRDGLLMRLSGDPGERHCTMCRESFATIPRQLEKAVVVAQDFSDDGCFIPSLEQSPRKAKVIPFGR